MRVLWCIVYPNYREDERLGRKGGTGGGREARGYKEGALTGRQKKI